MSKEQTIELAVNKDTLDTLMRCLGFCARMTQGCIESDAATEENKKAAAEVKADCEKALEYLVNAMVVQLITRLGPTGITEKVKEELKGFGVAVEVHEVKISAAKPEGKPEGVTAH